MHLWRFTFSTWIWGTLSFFWVFTKEHVTSQTELYQMLSKCKQSYFVFDVLKSYVSVLCFKGVWIMLGKERDQAKCPNTVKLHWKRTRETGVKKCSWGPSLAVSFTVLPGVRCHTVILYLEGLSHLGGSLLCECPCSCLLCVLVR